MSEVRQCTLCGRKGQQGFVEISRKGFMCRSRASCDQRRRRLIPGYRTWNDTMRAA